MEPTSRSGHDRRQNIVITENDKRSALDRRIIINRIEHYTGILEKIPVFKELSIDQLKKILSISSHKTLRKKETLCAAGDQSNEIYVLIMGKLTILLPDGKVIARIDPLNIVGEMGIFTGNPRSATVVADDDSLVITINKNELLRLFKMDHDLCRVMLMNVIGDLSNKLRHLNELFDRLMQLHVVE